MNKQKFEAYLRDKLSILKEAEIDEIVTEYLQHIDMCVAEGVTEEEAIADFGDLDELVNDLLDAYKINRNERDFEKIEHRVKLTLNNIMDFINRIARSIMKRSSNEVVTLIVEFIIVIFAIVLINYFVEAVFGGFNSAFYFRPYFLTDLIRLVIGLVRVAVTTSISLAVFYWFAKERVLKNEDETYHTQSNDNDEQTTKREPSKPKFKKTEPGKETSVQVGVNDDSVDQEKPSIQNFSLHDDAVLRDSYVIDETVEKEDKIELENRKQQTSFENKLDTKGSTLKPKKEKSFVQKLVTFNLNIIRIFVGLCLIPAIVIGVFLGIGFGIVLFATLSGYGSIGLTMVLMGLILIYYYFLIVFIKFVGGKRA